MGVVKLCKLQRNAQQWHQVQFFIYFFSNILYNLSMMRFQKKILKDLVLFTTKGFFPLKTYENVSMCRLVKSFDPKVVFPFQTTLFEETIPTIPICQLNLHVQPQLDANLYCLICELIVGNMITLFLSYNLYLQIESFKKL